MTEENEEIRGQLNELNRELVVLNDLLNRKEK